jgi:hypothetical protein
MPSNPGENQYKIGASIGVKFVILREIAGNHAACRGSIDAVRTMQR